MTTRQDIIDHARKFLGVRWRHQGRSERGLDCIGLIVRVAHDLGLSDYDNFGYKRIADTRRLEEELDVQMIRVPRDLAKPGDVMLMQYGGNPQHVAIRTDHGIIHAMIGEQKVVEHRLNHIWLARIIRAYQFKGIE
jgi:cell wall-associated NlpC family hydrolase